jgi:hypothetical protein
MRPCPIRLRSAFVGAVTLLLGAAVSLSGTPRLLAQSPEPTTRSGCDVASAETPATPPAQGPDAGTSPGGDGSTGWTGGTGGSNIGTTPSGPTPASPTEHPETASGLDPAATAAAESTSPAC